jgi:cell wall-associated NlpC family hydrolase
MIKRFPYSILILSLLASCVSGGTYRDGWFSSMEKRSRIVRTAQHYLGAPYRYGGDTPRGFDCSGFVKYVYQRNGINLPRSVPGQYEAGRHIGRSQARQGDLVFFRTSRSRRLSHVGIYLGNNRFIHAPRTGKRVSYAKMDEPYWKKRYAGAVTFIKGSRI